MIECQKKEQCQHAETCPLIPVPEKENTARQCPHWLDMVAEKRAREIISYSVEPPEKYPRWSDFDFSINKIKSQIDIIRGFPLSDKKMMLITSPPGTGKSTACYCLLFDLLRQDVNAFYIRAKTLKESWEPLRQELARLGDIPDLIKKSNDAKFLVIDDFGNETRTDYSERAFFSYLEGNKKTVLCSNHNLDTLKKIYKDDWTHSRLDAAIPVGWNGEDYRRIGK
jgi:DNA replication protein DnaC